MKYRWYDLPEKELLELLHTDKEKGLTKKEAALRLKTDGKNVVNPVQKAPPCRFKISMHLSIPSGMKSLNGIAPAKMTRI